ncbi:MAG: NAD-dependent DNA ligase LigA [Planctomycetota bacterium]|nr:NAD-dependent DNA ligase LigA [Planctomycetota bacterium]
MPDIPELDEVAAARLRMEIQRHNDLYYTHATPEIADDQYDLLLSQLAALEARHPEWDRQDSPTNQVGSGSEPRSKRESFPPHRHQIPMLSITNTYSDEEVRKFIGRMQGALRDAGETENPGFTVEMKIDGLAVTLFYQDGVFARGATRGDGTVGEDVTHNLMRIQGIPKHIAESTFPAGEVEIRGEIYIPRQAFARLVAEQEEAGAERVFANPRNAAAGTLKLLDTDLVAKRGLECFLYQVVEAEKYGLTGQTATLAALEKWGLPVNPLHSFCHDHTDILAFRDRMDGERSRLPYDSDGLVIKLDSFSQQGRLGLGSKSPNWAVAYKFTPERAQTRVAGIRVQVGKLGRLTPVADLDPVFLSGSTISHASLHNESYVAEKKIRVGDAVLVEKAGEIIPQVYQVLLEQRPSGTLPFAMPTTCPVCLHPTDTSINLTPDKREIVLRFCPNPACPAQLQARIVHFAARDAMDIEGMGPAVVEWLRDAGFLHDVSDIYRLDQDTLLAMTKSGRKILDQGPEPGEATRFTENLLSAIDASKGRGLGKLLYALAIPDIGATTANTLARNFHSLERLEKTAATELANLPMGESASYRTLGDKLALSIREAIDHLPSPGRETLVSDTTTFLRRLHLPGLGTERLKAIARRFPRVEDLLTASQVELSLVEMGSSQVSRKLGQVAAESLRRYLDSPDNQALLTRLSAAGVKTGIENVSTNTPATGKVFVLTGTLPNMGRAQAKKMIETAGGLLGSSVGRSTDFLVAGESPGSKLAKALSLGVKVIDLDTLHQLCQS